MPVDIPDYTENLPNLPRSPLDILNEVANNFRRGTDGWVEATVFTLNPGGSTLFRYTFYLVVPALNDLTDPLFYAWHDAGFYPVTVLSSGGRQGRDEVRCREPENLEEAIAAILGSPYTRERVSAYIESAQQASGRERGRRGRAEQEG